MSCVEPLGHSTEVQGSFKGADDEPVLRAPTLTRAVSWMVEEKKISEEKDDDAEDNKEEEGKNA